MRYIALTLLLAILPACSDGDVGRRVELDITVVDQQLARGRT